MSATDHLLPFGVVVALWFATTGLVVWLDSRPARTFGRSLAAAGALAIAGLLAIVATAGDPSRGAAYAGFAAALAVWGWHEMSFLTGIVAGPRRAPLPAGAAGWTRFRLAAATLIHHELALAATALILLAVSWGAPMPTGALTFALLFAFRLSAKLNIFLGVPSFADELLPAHLAYLKSYFRKRAMNPLYPVSLALVLGATAGFGQAALAAEGGAAVHYSLLTALSALGLVEHLFLILPLRDGALWRWALASSPAAE